MSKLYQFYQTNPEKEAEGIDVPLSITNDDGTVPTFKLARMGGDNFSFQTISEEMMRPFQREIMAGFMDKKALRDLNIEIFCRTILKGWKNVPGKNNEPLSYTMDNAVRLLKELPQLYIELSNYSADWKRYQDAMMEENSKN